MIGNACATTFEQKVEGLRSAGMAYAYSLCHNREQAEDLVEEALIKLWKASERLVGEWVPYFKTIIHNDWCSSRRRPAPLSLDALAEKGFEPVSPVEEEVEDIRLTQLLSRLNPLRRELLLAEADGVPIRNTARALGLSMSDAKAELAEARESLQASLIDAAINGDSNQDLLWETTWYTIPQMVKSLEGVSRIWVMSRLRRYATAGRVRRINGRPTAIYPLFVLTGMKNELSRFPQVQEGWLSQMQIAALLQADWRWVKKTIRKNHLRGRFYRSPNCGVIRYYPPSAPDTLRSLIKPLPLAGEWLPLRTIHRRVKRSRLWALTRLLEMDIEAEERENRAGWGSLHWPPEVVDRLQEMADEHPDAGDWKTVMEMATSLGKGYGWVEARVTKMEVQGELRRVPGSGKSFPHYPPEVETKLRGETEGHRKPSGWRTVAGMAKDLDKSICWVMPRIKDKPWEMRMASNNRPERHYPRRVFNLLKRDAESGLRRKPNQDFRQRG